MSDCTAAIIDYRGKSPKKSSFGVPLVTAKVVKGGRILEPKEFIPVEDYDAWMRRGLPQAGDVLMTTEAPLGEIAQLDGRQVALAQRIIGLRGLPEVLDNDFLLYAMQSDAVQDQLRARATGTTVLGIRQRELRKVHIPIPPIREQLAIGGVLHALDDKLELNREMNRTLEEMVEAIFGSWFLEFEPVVAKASGGAPPNISPSLAALFPETFEDSKVGPIPLGWRVVPFSTLVDIRGGGTPKTTVDEYWGGEIPWFAVADTPPTGSVFVVDTQKSITQRGLAESSARLLDVGTTIITARGTVGNVALVGKPMAMNQSCYGLTGKKPLGPFFTHFAVREVIDELRLRAHGSVFDTIIRSTFDAVDFVVPPEPLMEAFERLVRPLLDRVFANLLESRTLEDLRALLLPRLLSGEIRLRETERMLSEAM